MLCALWKTQESLEHGTSDRARTSLVKYRAQVSAEFNNESQQDVFAFFGELVDRFKDREIAGGRFGIWGHVQEVHPMVTRGDRSFRLKHPVITHVDRIFRFVWETRRRCTRCQRVRAWYVGDDVLKVRPQVRDGGPMTVSEMYLAACAYNPKDEEMLCGSAECKNAKVKHVSQCRMMTAPNVLVVQVQRDGGRRIPVAVEEQLDLPGFASMQLIGVVYHNGPTIHSGHYTCLCRGPGGRFWFYDDERPVYRINEDVAHVKPSQVYMIVYARPKGDAQWQRECEIVDDTGVEGDVSANLPGVVAPSRVSSARGPATDEGARAGSVSGNIVVSPMRRLRRKTSAEEATVAASSRNVVPGVASDGSMHVLSPSRRLRRKTSAEEALACGTSRGGVQTDAFLLRSEVMRFARAGEVVQDTEEVVQEDVAIVRDGGDVRGKGKELSGVSGNKQNSCDVASTSSNIVGAPENLVGVRRDDPVREVELQRPSLLKRRRRVIEMPPDTDVSVKISRSVASAEASGSSSVPEIDNSAKRNLVLLAADKRAQARAERGIGDAARVKSFEHYVMSSSAGREEAFGESRQHQLRAELNRTKAALEKKSLKDDARSRHALQEETERSQTLCVIESIEGSPSTHLPGKCSSSEHVCGPRDFVRGCKSCGYMCHADCRDELCPYDPCGYCLSYDSCPIPTSANSELCKENQKNVVGCHACRRMGCFMSSGACHAKCTRFRHVCEKRRPGMTGCISCDKVCHADSKDPRCGFYLQERTQLTWSATAEQLLDTHAGTAGSIPHMFQVPWNFTNEARDELIVDGIAYKKGYGFPGDPTLGERNNCLIDSLRQCLSHMACDRQKVREDLVEEFGNIAKEDYRRRVTNDSYLDVECHWRAILQSLFRHNSSGCPTTCDLNDYCIVALYGDRPGHGAVLGNKHAAHRLVIINWGDVHFDPCHHV